MSVIREDFIRLSKQEIMLEDLQIIKEITGTSKITDETVPKLVEEGKTELNTEFTETISLLVAKLYNR